MIQCHYFNCAISNCSHHAVLKSVHHSSFKTNTKTVGHGRQWLWVIFNNICNWLMLWQWCPFSSLQNYRDKFKLHLIKFLKSQRTMPFCIGGRKATGTIVSIKVFCSFHLPEVDSQWLHVTSVTRGTYHCSCENIPSEVFW